GYIPKMAYLEIRRFRGDLGDDRPVYLRHVLEGTNDIATPEARVREWIACPFAQLLHCLRGHRILYQLLGDAIGAGDRCTSGIDEMNRTSAVGGKRSEQQLHWGEIELRRERAE